MSYHPLVVHARYRDIHHKTFCGCDPYLDEATTQRLRVTCIRCKATKAYAELLEATDNDTVEGHS